MEYLKRRWNENQPPGVSLKRKGKERKGKKNHNIRILDLRRYLTFRSKREHNVDMEYRYLFTTYI